MRAGQREKTGRTRRYSQRLRLSCILLTQAARQPQPWLIFNVRRASAVGSPGRRYRALVVLGPMAVSVLEFIRGAARAEGGVGGPAVGPPRERLWLALAAPLVAGLSRVGLVLVRH